MTPGPDPLSTLHLAGSARAVVTRPERIGGLEGSQNDFGHVLTRALDAAESPEAKARAAAEQFVSIALVQPLLTQLRETNHAAPPFAPSSAEKQFQGLFDAQVAQRITRAKRFPLVEAVAAQLTQRLNAEQPSGPERPPEPASAGGER